MGVDWVDFAAGCVGGFGGHFFGHPFDTVKVRMQAQKPGAIRYNGTWNCIVQIFTKESIRGFYKGFMAPLYGQVALNAIIFGVHGTVHKSLPKYFPSISQHDYSREIIAGSSAGLMQSVVVCPVELIKIRMQLQGSGERYTKKVYSPNQPFSYSSPVDCLKKIYKHEKGIRGVYRGFLITILRETPAFGIYFGAYAYLCDICCGGMNNANPLNFWFCVKLWICGGVAGSLSWIFTCPLDVTKTRLQSDGMGKTTYKGIVNCGKSIYKDEGFKALFRGLNASILRAFPTNGATLAIATLFIRFFDTSRDEHNV